MFTLIFKYFMLQSFSKPVRFINDCILYYINYVYYISTQDKNPDKINRTFVTDPFCRYQAIPLY